MDDIEYKNKEESFDKEDIKDTEVTFIYEADYTELSELIEDVNQSNEERDNEIFDTYSKLLISIDEKLELILEQSDTTVEESLLFEEIEQEELEEIDYTDLLTSLDTNLAHFSMLYETELLMQAEEPILEEKETTDYTELILSMDAKLEEVLDIKDTVHASSSAIVSYSVFYIPLAVIILSLYWFFSQFINRYY